MAWCAAFRRKWPRPELVAVHRAQRRTAQLRRHVGEPAEFLSVEELTLEAGWGEEPVTASAARVAQIRDHLATCRECERFGGKVGAIVAQVRRALGEADELDADIAERLRTRLRASGAET